MDSGRAPAPRRLRVAVAGASGFVGRALLPALEKDFDVVALTRDVSRAPAPAGAVEWRACDLFSLLDAERALEGADAAVYLVHSMMPSARLVQGSFEDLDLIAADNFARASRALFYVRGGLLASPGQRGRLEFREAPGGGALLAAIHDFRPRLPWPVYVATQARVHLAVMRAFGRHLGGLPAHAGAAVP